MDLHNPYARGERIERVIAHHAERTPEAIALRQGDRAVTYAQLRQQAVTMAEALHAAGVRHGDCVPVRMERSPELVVALLAVLEAGATYIAVDTAWPAARTDLVIQRSGASVVVSEGNFARLAAGAAEPVPLGPFEDGTDAACVFFTSGSTGQPKGVLSPHRGTIRTLVDCPSIPLDADSVFLQSAPLPWDGMSLELWAPLLNGGCCVLLDRDRPAVDAATLRELVEGGVNSLWLTSSLFNVLTEEDVEAFHGIRLLLVGGERVSPAHVRRVLTAFPTLHIVNGYGPAESTIFATTHVVRAQDVDGTATEIPIGRPVPRTGVALVNSSGGRTDPGDIGEIAISGDGLALRYLADPEATAKAFFDLDAVRHYRTGDLAVLDEDGTYRYRGRADREFKIRGVRIAPGEVEKALEAHPEIATSCVMRMETTPGRPELACAYTTLHGAPLDSRELRDFAARTLLDAMMPTRQLHLRHMPLSATGKADYAAVRVLLEQDAAPTPASAAPVTDSSDSVAHQLLAETGELLGRPGIAPHEDLFHAGLTSLDAVRLASRISSRTGAHTTAADVYRQRTLDKLLESSGDREQSADAGPASLGVDHGDAPLSRAQKRFWLSEEFTPGDADNVIVLAYALTGPLDVQRFEASLGHLVARHAVLRTVYPYEGTGAVQRTLPADIATVSLEHTTAPHHTHGDDLRELAEEISADWWGRPTDLEKEPSLRLRLCRVDEQTHLFCVRVHHLAFDGWSETLFMEDLAAAMAPNGSPAEPPHVTYAGFSRWEQDRLGSWLQHDLPYWQEVLREPPRPFLPSPSEEDTQARRVESVLRVSPEVVARLTSAADTFGGPPVAALLAAAGRSLSQVFGVADLCLGTVSTGRHDPGLEPIVGCFVNSLPIPLASVPAQGAAELLTTCARTVAAALQHARTPFDELVRSLRPERDRHPWFQTWVIVQREPPRVCLGEGVSAEPLRIRPPHTGFELLIEAVPQPDGAWELLLSRRADGMSDAQAERLLEQLGTVLRELSTAA
ncbi:amino acid adenylation domain-containing protein [Streptomyces prunicolor]